MTFTTAVGHADDQGATPGDAEAIAELRAVFAAQRAAVLRDPAPGIEQRRRNLGTLVEVISAYRHRIQEALAADFAVHPAGFADLVEVLGVAGRAAFAAQHLEEWMTPESRLPTQGSWERHRSKWRTSPRGSSA